MKLIIAVLGAILVFGNSAAAYTTEPVRIVVPFPPGGGTDVIARTILNPLSEALGVKMFIDNKAGAQGVVGTEIVAKAKPDGLTLLLGGIGSLTINPHTQDLPYDAEKDFIPVTLLVKSDILLLASPKSSIRTVKDFIELAKKDGHIRYASSGVAGPNHLMGEMFAAQAGIKMVHVPYRGEGPAFTDMIGGHIESGFLSVAGSAQFVDSGQLIAVAACGITRSARFPNVPTISESGLPGFDAASWQGIFVPAGTPLEIVRKIQQAVATIFKDQALREKIAAQGNTPVGNTPEEFAAFVRAESAKWAKAVAAAGLGKPAK
jgi:tripartite-type tricarboxylate transporter receptor subunit TctC